MKNKGRVIAILIGISILFSGCSSVREVFNPNTVPADTEKVAASKDTLMDQGPVRGGSLRLFSTYPDTFNPILTTNIYVREMLMNIYEGMVEVDNHLNPVPLLAEKWVVSEDLLTWTFILRKDVFWHDNIPFTAEDVEFTMDAIMKYSGQSTYRSRLSNIAAYAAVDKYTFRVSLKSPNSFTAETMDFPILAKHYYTGQDFIATDKNLKPMGTGPYKFSSYEPKKNISLMLNEKWWGAKGTDGSNVLKPYITELQYHLYESGKDAVNAFQASDIDISGLSNADSAKYYGRQDLSIRRYPNREYNFLAFNLARPALSSKKVRQSIGYAINRDRIIKDILPGQATISELPALPNTWVNDAAKKNFEYNPDKTRQLLAEDGWKQNQYGLYNFVSGNYAQLNLELLVNSENESRVNVAQYISDDLAQVGIKVNIKKVDFNTYQSLLASKSYDIAIAGARTPATPDFSFLYGSWSNRSYNNSCYNISGFANSNMDSLLGKAMTTRGTIEDGNKLKQIYTDIRSIALDELPYFGLYFSNDSMIYNKRVRGEISPSVLNRYNDITRWYIP